jgi:hypothetical protein
MDVDGVTLTYYLDNIQTINGIDAGVANPNPGPPASAAGVVAPPAPVETPAPAAITAPTPGPATQPTQSTTPTPPPAVAASATVTAPAAVGQMPPDAFSELQYAGISKHDLILKFIDVFGTRDSLTRNLAELIKRSPPQQGQLIQKAVDIDELIEQLVPIYDKYFTDKDLMRYVDFYSSDSGQKLLQTVPKLMEDSVGVSLKYFKEKLPQNPAPAKK